MAAGRQHPPALFAFVAALRQSAANRPALSEEWGALPSRYHAKAQVSGRLNAWTAALTLTPIAAVVSA